MENTLKSVLLAPAWRVLRHMPAAGNPNIARLTKRAPAWNAALSIKADSACPGKALKAGTKKQPLNMDDQE